MPPKPSSSRSSRATARKSIPGLSYSKSTTDASPTIHPSDTITSREPVPSPPSPTIEAATKTPETASLISPESRKSSSKTACKCTVKTASSKSSSVEAPANAAPETTSDVTPGTETASKAVSVASLPETSAEKITETNHKNSEEMRQDETPAEKASETAATEAAVPENIGESGQETGLETARVGATAKKGAKTVVKKTVRVVKKVVKKKVPKKVQVVSSNEESVKAEVDNDGENPNPSVLGAMDVESPKPVGPDSMEAENLKPEPNASVSLEVENTNSDVAVSMEAENPNSDAAASISVAVKNSNSNISGSMEVDNPEEPEAAEGKENDSTNQKVSDAPVSNLIEDMKNGNEREQAASTAEVQLGVQNVGLVQNQKDEIEIQNVDSKGGEGKEGAKQVVDKCDVSGLKGEFGMGDGVVLSGEMEALERRKRRKTEIFIGGLDKDAKEEDVRKVFQEVGEIVEVRLLMNDKTGKNKGFAFVQYASAADAMKALAKFAKVEICGKQCGATPVEGTDTIFLGNIDKKWKSEDIVKLLQEIGIEKIDKVIVMADPSNIECNRGFAFLELETKRDAKNAYRKLQKKDVFGKQQKIKVAWAKPLCELDEEEMLKVKSVYAEYLPSSWDEEKVKDHFKKFGEIENVVLARNLHSSRRKDFAFVNYTTREAALACIEAFNRESLNVGGSKVNVKVSLAKSMLKEKQVKHVLNPVSKEPPKEKPKAARFVIKPHQPRTKGKSGSSNHEDIRVNRRSSTTAELVQLLREQASLRQPQTGLGIGSVDQGYPYSLPARKRPVSLLGDDTLYSDPRRYPRTRFESSFTVASPSGLSQGVAMTSLPYYRQQGSGYASGSPYGVEVYRNSFQTRGAPYHESSGIYSRCKSSHVFQRFKIGHDFSIFDF